MDVGRGTCIVLCQQRFSGSFSAALLALYDPAAAGTEQNRQRFAESSCPRQGVDLSLQIQNPHELERTDSGSSQGVNLIYCEPQLGSLTQHQKPSSAQTFEQVLNHQSDIESRSAGQAKWKLPTSILTRTLSHLTSSPS